MVTHFVSSRAGVEKNQTVGRGWNESESGEVPPWGTKCMEMPQNSVIKINLYYNALFKKKNQDEWGNIHDE